MAGNVYGKIFLSQNFEADCVAQLAAWMPAYLAEVERQAELAPGSLARPGLYDATSEADSFPGEKLPALYVVSPGTLDQPEQLGDGVWAGWMQISVIAIVAAPTEQNVRRLAGLYAGAIRALVLQQGIEGAELVRFRGEEYQGAPGEQRNRTLAAAVVNFSVFVETMVEADKGPLEPPEDPLADPGDWPTVGEALLDRLDNLRS